MAVGQDMLHDLDGCVIKPEAPPPPGYKCNCKNRGVWPFFCYGELEACDSPNDYGCSGCFEKECCSDAGAKGDCKGY